MKQLTLVVAVVLAVVCAGAGLASAESNEGGISSDLKNEKVIRNIYNDFIEAWNRHDWKTMGDMWTLDGDQQDPDGRIAHGREEITALLKKQHETVFRDTKLDLTVDGVWFIKGDVALVTGDYSLQGVVAPDGTKLAPRGGFLTSILLHERGKWQIVASRLMIPTPVPYRAKP
ncbi:MAG: YybH family protein [Candidatus Binatia bacterium]